MSWKQFHKELADGFSTASPPTYLLHADDHSLLKEAMLEARDSVPPEERDFGLLSFDLESPEVPLEHMIDALNTVPFMGGRQLVIMEGLHKLKAADQKPLLTYLESPSPNSVLLLFYAGKPRKTLVNKLSGIKEISLSLREQDIPYWIEQRAISKGVSLQKDAIEYLIGTIGSNAGLLSAEVEKFASLGGKDGTTVKLGRNDISALVKGQGEYDAFDLIKVLKTGNAKRVFKIYAVLAQTQEAYSLLGVLNWHYDRLKLSAEKRTKIFKLLSEADLMIKSTGGAYPMEHLLAKLLRA